MRPPCRIMLSLAAFVWGTVLLPNSGSGQVASVEGSRDSAAVMEVGFKIQEQDVDRGILESVQAALQGTAGVPYVGIDYRTAEVTVRYLTPEVTIEKLLKIPAGDQTYQVSVAAGPELVGPANSLRTVTTQKQLKSTFSNITLECLHQDDAQVLSDRYSKGKLPEGMALEDCYAIKVDFQTTTRGDGNYNWLSLAGLVDNNGKLIKPLSWLELPTHSGAPLNAGTSGLLLFPKLPVLRLGLMLRLLRESGDGYDSFTVTVPEIK